MAAAAVPAMNATVPTAAIFAAPLATSSMAPPSFLSSPELFSASLPWSLVFLELLSSSLPIFSACLPASSSPSASPFNLSSVSAISRPQLFMAVWAAYRAVCSVLT